MRYTRIFLPGLARLGITRQGILSAQDMCDLMRAHATRAADWLEAERQEILRADDSDFHVERMMNANRVRNIKVIQRGKGL